MDMSIPQCCSEARACRAENTAKGGLSLNTNVRDDLRVQELGLRTSTVNYTVYVVIA